MVEVKRARKSNGSDARANVIPFPSARISAPVLKTIKAEKVAEVKRVGKPKFKDKKTNVISLDAARKEREWQRLAHPTGSLDVDWAGVQRFCSVDEYGQFVRALGDQIVLSAKAEAQVRSIFWRHGLRQMPGTWGELEGNWNYCRLLGLWLIAFAPDESPSMRRGMIARHNKRHPGRGELLRLLSEGDLDGAHCWHQQDGTFARNATDPKLTTA